ncbi:DNA ligase [Anaeramoeba flamelloides]|uniref:Poly [ADP-ribose] polymerase n=1 Tax=Anaeramoeba flamelloides TaxID=1746091 RepID=A0ABQ8X124_9EUKA|nr:DNA ligase [Anaeramoeba flamelloides]
MSFFSKKYFLLSKPSTSLEKKIKKHGGTVMKRMGAKCNYFIVCDLPLSAKVEKRIESLKKYSPEIVKQEWVKESIKKKKLLATKKFLIEEEDEESEEDEEDEEKEDRKRKKKSKKGASKKKKNQKKTKDKEKKKPEKKNKGKGKKKEEKKKEKKKDKDKDKKRRPRVVPVSQYYPFATDSEVYIDGDEIYSVMTNQTNIGFNNNKYYEIQIIKDGGQFKLFTSWGRVGYRGQSKVQAYSSAGPAIREFQKKFKLKTGNNWADRDNFVPKNRKYQPVEVVYEDESDDSSEESSGKEDSETDDEMSSDEKPIESTLAPEIQDFIKLIFNKTILQNTLASLNINQDKAPLGKLSKSQLKKGFEILKKIEDIISGKKSGDLQFESSHFYTTIPHSFGMKTPPTISSKIQIQQKVELLDTLKQISVAGELIKEKEKKKKKKKKETKHLLDQYYEELNCKLEVVEKNSKEWELIKDYVNKGKNARGSWKPKIKNIFRTIDPVQMKNFKKYEQKEGKWLLWHGSRLCNVVGIVKNGLRIAPPEAPATGYDFGKGVYFANAFGKSAEYTHAGKGTAVMYLNEVYLGEMLELKRCQYITNLPKGKHSTWGLGTKTPDPKKTIEFNDMNVPLGNITTVNNGAKCWDEYDEFIVYNTDQIRCRYLITTSIH